MDMEAATWTVPAERMTANVEHRGPRSPRSVAILAEAESIHDGSDLVFQSPLRPASPALERARLATSDMASPTALN